MAKKSALEEAKEFFKRLRGNISQVAPAISATTKATSNELKERVALDRTVARFRQQPTLKQEISQGIGRVSTAFKKDPLQFSLLSVREKAVPAITTFGGALGFDPQQTEDVAFGARGALSITPFQRSGKKLDATTPVTDRQKFSERLGRAAYGTALTGPIGGGSMAFNIAMRVLKGSILGTAIGSAGNLLRGEPLFNNTASSALSGVENSWQLAFTALATDKLVGAVGLSRLASDQTANAFKLLKDASLMGASKEVMNRLFIKGASTLLFRAIAETPVENTFFTLTDQLDPDEKRGFIESWIKNLPGTLAGNLIFAGGDTAVRGTLSFKAKELEQAREAIMETLGQNKDLLQGEEGFVKLGAGKGTSIPELEPAEKKIKPGSIGETQMKNQRANGLGVLADLDLASRLPKGSKRDKIVKELVDQIMEAPEGSPLAAYKSTAGNVLEELTGKQLTNVAPKGDIALKTQAKLGVTEDISPKQQIPSPIKTSGGEQLLPGKDLEGVSSPNIITDKRAFNINKARLGLKGDDAKKLDTVVNQMRPILEETKGKALTNQEVITGGRKAILLDEILGRQQSSDFSSRLQSSRNFLATEAQEAGVTPKFLEQLKVVSSTAADAGRRLRAFSVNAEDNSIKMKVLKDLQKIGVQTDELLKEGEKVDWTDTKQVTEFYRRFKPANLVDQLTEYRYVNMLSSPNTHIVNTFSNFIQTGIVAPVEKTLTGGLDFARSRLTGTERKHFASEGVDFARGYWKALPEGWSKFKESLGGHGPLTRPDVKFIPSGTGKARQIFSTPLRALEAADQFFITLTKSGELEALKGKGIVGEEAQSQAAKAAEYRIFRQGFDPDGKLGQGGMLQVWDKWNSAVANLRRVPGGRWIIPFLQTPTNILKQGVEYSPLGLSTIPGAKEPLEQLSKTIIGTSVFTAAYALANSGLTTWDAPINQKAKSEFYAAGLQPYSVKIGDKWVSYSKLGPLSYPIAMASSLVWAQKNGLEDGEIEKLAKGLGGMLQFFSDQSYVKNIGDVVEAVQGGANQITTSGQALTSNTLGQLVPYRSLLGWITRLVDPVYRKARSIPERLGAQIPGLSKLVPAHETPTGGPSIRQMPLLNAFLPGKITQEVHKNIQLYQMGRDIRRMKKVSNIESDARKEQAQNLYEEWKQLPKEEANSRAKKLKTADPRLYDSLKGVARDAKLGLTYEERLVKGLGVTNGDRARYILKQVSQLTTKEEKNTYINNLRKKRIITDQVFKQLKRLK